MMAILTTTLISGAAFSMTTLAAMADSTENTPAQKEALAKGMATQIVSEDVHTITKLLDTDVHKSMAA